MMRRIFPTQSSWWRDVLTYTFVPTSYLCPRNSNF